MDDRSSLALLLNATGQWRRQRRAYRGVASAWHSLWDQWINHLPWRRWRGRGQVRLVRLRGIEAPFAIRVGTSDLTVLREIFVEGEYQPVTQSDLGAVRQVVDLGANIGMSLRWWRLHWPDARLIAVEPDEENLALARRNLELAGHSSEACFIMACVGSVEGLVELDRTRPQWSYRMKTSEPLAPGSASADGVSLLTMPTILDRAALHDQIDLLKIDIEGAERQLFADCGAWIHRVRHIVVELHRDFYSLSELTDELARAGWRHEEPRVLSQVYHTVVWLTARS